MVSQEEPRLVKLPSRVKKEMNFSFSLTNLPQAKDKKKDKKGKYHCSLNAKTELMQAMLDSTCRIVKDFEEMNSDKVNYVLNFLSYRPFSCPFVFEVCNEDNGCKW